MRLASATVAALAPVLGLFAGTATPATAVTSTATSATQCPYVAHDLRNIPALEQQIGSPMRCAVVFHDYMETWTDWERPWFAVSPNAEFQWDDFGRVEGNTLVMTLNLVPKNMPADWRTRGANGEYDAHIRALATNLVNAGLGNEVIRLGSEANGTWRPDHIGNTEAEYREWARYWNHFVKVTRTVPGADFVFDWNINSGYRAIAFDLYYPGDDVVDIIGIDQYDSLPAPKTADRWYDIANQNGGPEKLAAFARLHNKPLSLPEVGLVSSTNYGADDNPAYVNGLADLISKNKVAYIGYFNKNVGGTLRLEEVPNSAATWRSAIPNGGALNAITASKLASVPTATPTPTPTPTPAKAPRPTKKPAPVRATTRTVQRSAAALGVMESAPLSLATRSATVAAFRVVRSG